MRRVLLLIALVAGAAAMLRVLSSRTEPEVQPV